MKLSFKWNSSSLFVRYLSNRVCSLINWCSTTEKSKTILDICAYYVVCRVQSSYPFHIWDLHLMMSLQLSEFETISVSTHEIRTNDGDNMQQQIIIILIYSHFLWFVIVFEISNLFEQMRNYSCQMAIHVSYSFAVAALHHKWFSKCT